MLPSVFDQACFEDLAMCGKGAELQLTASVRNVTITPSLDVLETSSDEPVFQIQGNVLTVERGCSPPADADQDP